MEKMNIFRRIILPLLLGVPGTFFWFLPGFPVTDDGDWMIIRLSAFYETLRGGELPVRFVARLMNGYGYPVADFLYPLYLYAGSFLHIFGLSFVIIVKLLFVASFLLSGLFCFLWLEKRFSFVVSLIGSLFYLYFPYHLTDLNQRGSLGEMLSLAIVPFILWSIERKSIWWISIGIALLLLAHNTLALLFLPCVFVYGLLTYRTWNTVILPFIFGIGMAMFFILPALLDQKFTQFGTTAVADAPAFVISSIELIGILLLAVFGYWLCVKKNAYIPLVWIGISVLICVLMWSGSSSLWTQHLLLKYVQFPMRFLSILIMSVTFVSAYVLHWLPKKLHISVLILAVGASILVVWFYKPQAIRNLPDGFYTTNESSTTTRNEYLPKGAHILSHDAMPDVSIATGAATIDNFVSRGNSESFQVHARQESVVVLHKYNYPGWQVHSDGNALVVRDTSTGLVSFTLPQGDHMVILKMKETAIQLLSDGITCLSFVALCVYTMVRRKNV